MITKNEIKCQAGYAKYCLNHKTKKLQLGCGPNIIDGFFNTDIYPPSGAYYVDATQPLPFSNSSFHYIFSEHNFEHISYHEGKVLLKECLRILKPGGVIRLTMPCLEFLIDIYNNPKKEENQRYMKWHFHNFEKEQLLDFGDEYSPAFLVNNFMRMWGHKCIYDKKTINSMLQNIGFQDVCFFNVSESNHKELSNVEHHQTIIPVEYNAMETICVEARKPESSES